jgi:CheY-like chemotaxis protein
MNTHRNIDLRILVADDDLALRAGVCDLLGGPGFEIIEAGRGDDALEIVRRGPIDLAVLDYEMPGCTGIDILKAVESELLHIPCILLSGLDIASMALNAGASAVFRKPIEPIALRNEVLRVLGLNN